MRNVLVTLVLLVSLPILPWVLVARSLDSEASRLGRKTSEIVPYEDPELRAAAATSLAGLRRPYRAYRADPQRAWAVLAVFAAVLGLALGRLRRPGPSTALLIVLSLSPTSVGAGLVPGGIVEGFQALQEQGVRSPAALGAEVGEAFAPVVCGLWATVVLSVLLAVVLPAGKRSDRPT